MADVDLDDVGGAVEVITPDQVQQPGLGEHLTGVVQDYTKTQAREVVDLSVLSQRQIIENLQQLAGPAETGADRA